MQVSFALLADSATLPPDGKVYILGGGINNMMVPELPTRVGFVVVAEFRFAVAELASDQSVELRLVDADGKFVVAPTTLQFPAAGSLPPEATEITAHTVTAMSPTFGEPGTYVVELWHQSRIVWSGNLAVAAQKLPQQQPGRPN